MRNDGRDAFPTQLHATKSPQVLNISRRNCSTSSFAGRSSVLRCVEPEFRGRLSVFFRDVAAPRLGSLVYLNPGAHALSYGGERRSAAQAGSLTHRKRANRSRFAKLVKALHEILFHR